MGKFPNLSSKKVCRILETHGFAEVRRKGSHIVMQKRIKNSSTTVIVPDHKEIKIGTLQSIIRQSKLPRSVFR